jgi:hypothetical protein
MRVKVRGCELKCWVLWLSLEFGARAEGPDSDSHVNLILLISYEIPNLRYLHRYIM